MYLKKAFIFTSPYLQDPILLQHRHYGSLFMTHHSVIRFLEAERA